jgi:hypothetical protein
MKKKELIEEVFIEDSSYDQSDALLQEKLKTVSSVKNLWRWHILGRNFEFALDVPWHINWWQRFWLKFFFHSDFEKLT